MEIHLAFPACRRLVWLVASWTRTISKRVRPVKRAYFYTRCWSPAYRPRRVVVTCADANFQFWNLRWRRWNRPVARARGPARVNDCVPFCAGGAFHSLPARVRLAGLKRCPPGESHNGFYAYTALRSRILSFAPYLGALTTGQLRTSCCSYG